MGNIDPTRGLIVEPRFWIFQNNGKNYSSNFKTAQINGQKIFVEIADTPEKRSQGLSGRDNLSQNQGMLFIFNQPAIPSFWMKDMNFPLDFIWINNNQVIAITENIQPQDYQPPKTLPMNQKVDMVLEVNAGTVGRLDIKTGDKIKVVSSPTSCGVNSTIKVSSGIK